MNISLHMFFFRLKEKVFFLILKDVNDKRMFMILAGLIFTKDALEIHYLLYPVKCTEQR